MRKHSRRVALIVAHPMRDLPGLVLAAVALCQRGIVCHLIPGSVRKREVWGLAPDMVLLFNVQKTQADFISRLHMARLPFGLLDTEGGVWADLQDYADLLLTDGSLTRAVRPVCAWSSVLSDYVVSKGVFSKDQIALTGCPRFDFYADRWRPVLVREQSEPNRPRVLVNTAFSEYNAGLSTPEDMYRELMAIPGWSEERVRTYLNTQKEGLEKMIQLVRTLADDYPHVDFVLRPHPAESSAPYRAGLAGIQNISINGAGPVQSQLFNASAVIQRSCTTAIESNLAGVPTFSPQFVPIAPVVPTAESVSVPCGDYHELRCNLDRVVKKTWILPAAIACEMRSVIGKWFHQIDGDSHERVAAAIETAWPERNVDEQLCRKWFYGLNGRPGASLQSAARRVRYLFRLSPNCMVRGGVPEPASDTEFNVDVVRALSSRVTAILRSQNTGVRSIDVRLASDRDDFHTNYRGSSVTLEAR